MTLNGGVVGQTQEAIIGFTALLNNKKTKGNK